MNNIQLTFKQQIIFTIHSFKNALGFPVNYAPFEFAYFKSRLNWAEIPEERIKLLSMVFNTSREQIQQYINEAEEIVVASEKSQLTQKEFEGVGDPMGRTDRITLYASIRSFMPDVVVETGTGAGASSVYILSALHKNQKGYLYSIDSAKDPTNVGKLISDNLRQRLHLFYGGSLAVFSEILKKVHSIDFFFHDSSHFYSQMFAEYEWAYNAMTHSGIICSHDVLMTNAWRHFIKKHRLRKCGVVKNFGVCLIEK